MRRAGSHLELVDAVGGNPCVRYEIPDDLPYPAWISGSSALMVRTSHTGRLGLARVGSAEDLVGLIAELAGTGALSGIASVTMLRSEIDAIAPHLRLTGAGGKWDWLWTVTAPPANDAEIEVVELNDAADATEIRALNARGLPAAESEPDSGRTELWLGVRTAGRRQHTRDGCRQRRSATAVPPTRLPHGDAVRQPAHPPVLTSACGSASSPIRRIL
ncbi:MAG: hypothetical protein ACR2P2_17095 [Nakamurella sp.]